ncbi:hypothetical protein GCM10017714_33570 [Curtobacterium pusillum]|nr:hypothetical protein GCM10017610_18940 [Curtobacterium pusillum]
MRARHARQIRSGIVLAREVWDLVLYMPGALVSCDTTRTRRLEAVAMVRESRAIHHRRQRERVRGFSERGTDDTQRSHRRSLPQPDQKEKNGRRKSDP